VTSVPAATSGQPAWLAAPAGEGLVSHHERAGIEFSLWSPPGIDDATLLPLLVVNDGPEYDKLAGLTRYLAVGVTGDEGGPKGGISPGKWLPPLRAVLLSPGDRNRRYSASPRYAHALVNGVLPSLPATKRIGMGTSLGALAMLHAHCTYPAAFEAMFLQSGSFFTPRFDAHERRFPYYSRVVRFVASIRPAHPMPVSLTCGVTEENLQNNRQMTQLLRDHGYPAALHEVPGAHDWPSWRDAFEPHLTALIQRVLR
jgi:enterochelin esterase family protein